MTAALEVTEGPAWQLTARCCLEGGASRAGQGRTRLELRVER